MTASSGAVVFIVDDEAVVGDSIAMLLSTVDLATRVYRDARTFLAEYTPDQAGCLLLDVRMPRVSGLEVQQELVRKGIPLPVIFITGHGDVPMAVEAMRAGAVDFIQKPFNDDDLIRRVQAALAEDASQRERLRRRDELMQLWDELTPREQEVARRMAEGQANKVMASELGISERTVELHRARVMQKMSVRSLAQLVRLLVALDGTPG
jgi:two-component system response regulator FixJ